MDFLFEPQQAVLNMFKHELDVLSTTSALKIGIQVAPKLSHLCITSTVHKSAGFPCSCHTKSGDS